MRAAPGFQPAGRGTAAIATRLLVAGVSCLAAMASPGASIPSPLHPDVRARQIIERGIQAHGGRQAWLGKKDVSFSTVWTHYQAGLPNLSSRFVVKFPIALGPVRSVVEGEENGRHVVMGVSGSRSWFVVGTERYEDVESLKANRAFVRKAYGLLALPFRLDDPSIEATHDGEEVRAGRVVDRVKVRGGLEATGLYLFDRETGRLVGMGSEMASPPTATVSDHDDFVTISGILIPQRQVFDRVDPLTGGRSRLLTVRVETVRFDNDFPATTFEPPTQN